MDLWHWRAIYEDGTHLDEYDAVGRQSGWKDVAKDELAVFLLIPTIDGVLAGLPTHQLKVDAGCRPIFFRRRQVTTGVGMGDTITVIGLQMTLPYDPVNEATCYLALYPDGTTLLCSDEKDITM